VNFRTTDWLKKLGTISTVGPTSAAFNLKTRTPLTPWPAQPVSNPMQQTTGRVGGIQTTAQQTQPLSAQLGGWFGQFPGRQSMQPFEAFMSWLSPQVAQMLRGRLNQSTQPWTRSLPQNITGNLLKRRRGGQ
jgi:hypothetical protein